MLHLWFHIFLADRSFKTAAIESFYHQALLFHSEIANAVKLQWKKREHHWLKQ